MRYRNDDMFGLDDAYEPVGSSMLGIGGCGVLASYLVPVSFELSLLTAIAGAVLLGFARREKQSRQLRLLP